MWKHDPARALKRLPRGLLGMLALVVAIEGFVGRNALLFMNAAEVDWMTSGRTAMRKADKFDILAFGDSMIKFGIVPRVLETKLGKTAYNFALLDGKPALTYILFRRAIEAGARPKAVIVDYPPEGLHQPPANLVTNRHWSALFASPREAWELARIYHDRAFFGHLIVSRLLPTYRCRNEIRFGSLKGFQGHPATNFEVDWPVRHNWQVNRGGVLLPKQPGYRGDVPPEIASDLLNDRCAIKPENARYVRRLLRLAAENRVPVYWLLPPNVPRVMAHRDGCGVHATIDRFARGLLEQFPNLTVIDARHSGYDSSVFFDAVHLDRDGAVALSSDLADVLRQSVIDSEPVPRWIDLPAYRDRPVTQPLEDVHQTRAAMKVRAEKRLR